VIAEMIEYLEAGMWLSQAEVRKLAEMGFYPRLESEEESASKLDEEPPETAGEVEQEQWEAATARKRRAESQARKFAWTRRGRRLASLKRAA
jgi:hypothetical protein